MRTYLWWRDVLEGTDAPLLDLRTHLRDRIGRLRSRRVVPLGGSPTFLLEELRPTWEAQPYFNDSSVEYLSGLHYGAVAALVPGRGLAPYGVIPPGLQYLRSQMCTDNLDLVSLWPAWTVSDRVAAEADLTHPSPEVTLSTDAF